MKSILLKFEVRGKWGDQLGCAQQPLHTVSLMPQGQTISRPVQEIVLRLSSLLPNEDISFYTGISLRSVERILQHFKSHGVLPEAKERPGRTRKALRDVELAASSYISYLWQ